MKQDQRPFILFLVLLFLCTFLPMMTPYSAAAGIPTLVLQSDTATNPILDHELDFETYHSGGPFTVTFQWKTDNLQPLDGEPTPFGTVVIFGATYGTNESQADPGLTITANTDWTTQSFTFQNVGTFPIAGVNMPGNFLRFALWKASGELRIRNLIIQNAAGDVVYDLNTDPAVQQAITDMQRAGLTNRTFADIQIGGQFDFSWMDGQFGRGFYAGHLAITDGPMPAIPTPGSVSPNSKPTTRPATTTWPCTTGHKWNDDHNMCQVCSKPYSTGTKPVNTCTNETGHVYLNHYCMYCGEISPWYAGCLQGQHGYNINNVCVHCGYPKPGVANNCANGHAFRYGVCQTCGYLSPDNPCRYGHDFLDGFCVYCHAEDPDYHPCANGHTYENGYCIWCAHADPSGSGSTSPATRYPTTRVTTKPITPTTWPKTQPTIVTTYPTASSTLAPANDCIGRPTTKPTINPTVNPTTLSAASTTTPAISTTRPTTKPITAGQPMNTGATVTNPIVMQSPEGNQEVTVPSTNVDTTGTPTQRFDPTLGILIAIVAVALVGFVVTIVVIKKR